MVERFQPSPLTTDGEAWTPRASDGAGIEAGHYDGPEAHAVYPWKCPKCRAENTGPLEQGCAVCGSGQPGYHVGVPPPVTAAALPPPAEQPYKPTDPGPLPALYHAARAWADSHTNASLAEAFVAGYQTARATALHAAKTGAVSETSTSWSASGKVTRTIVAALEMFADQVLPIAAAEIASGEWCSAEEVAGLIATYRESM